MTNKPLSRPAKRILSLMRDSSRDLIFAHMGPLSDLVKVWDENEGDFESRTRLAVMDELAVAGYLPCRDGQWDMDE